MITPDGWFDWMTRKDGPADKVYSDPCTSDLYIPHSAVGNAVEGWYSRLYSTARQADGRYTPYAAASVTGWFFKEAGRAPEQYFSLRKSCWASGTKDWNTRGNAFENAGGPPGNPTEPLTEWQIACNVRAMKEIAEWKGRPVTYWKRPAESSMTTATLYEHRESVWFGGAATGCPNSRIPWDVFKQRLLGTEDDMYEQTDRDRDANVQAQILELLSYLKGGTFGTGAAATTITKADSVLGRLKTLEGDGSHNHGG